jgi:UDP-N-acetyl-alpha-D-muramoyl-L-alanyl-L-glutamate epimerase
MSEHFEIEGWSLVEDCSLAFRYRSPKFGLFAETITFPETHTPLSVLAKKHGALLDVVAVVLGVSYYKTDPTKALSVKSGFPTDAAHAFSNALYVEGLAEFYVRNGLAYPPDFRFVTPGEARSTRSSIGERESSAAKEKAIVAFGGGKDSHVALALLKEAGVDVEPTIVTLSEKSEAKLRALSARALTNISRRIDPALLSANKAGALNGHIPITAINSLLLVIYAILRGADWVVFANERSADEPTLMLNGHEINHQFSKTYRCETLLRKCLQSISADMPDYFSLLRPVSELWIARKLAQLPDALETFSSCNRNFVFSGPNALPPGVRWCGRCAKCVFTALITAPFLSRSQSVAVFAGDVLNDPANAPVLRELVGLSEAKPWDCVGTIREAAAALSRLDEMEEWRSARAVAETLAALHAKWDAAYLSDAFLDALIGNHAGFLPKKMMFVYER